CARGKLFLCKKGLFKWYVMVARGLPLTKPRAKTSKPFQQNLNLITRGFSIKIDCIHDFILPQFIV
ncbi:MAG: hypothetical protein OEY38_23420, partial [Gammaproteobacteria bacterium]|nr:hypothetical protein [Gammaproteobacteria bacterium]